jgi:predicted nucleotidyltransferase
MMTKIEIKQKLREHSPLFKQYHVRRIGIFGSFVNGMQDEKSDIDLPVDFSDTITLFDYVRLADL